ncbi:MAG: YaeQ family protein [Nitrosospira sp.]
MNLPLEASRAIAKQAQRNMHLNCTIQDGQIWLADEKESVFVELVTLKRMPPV